MPKQIVDLERERLLDTLKPGDVIRITAQNEKPGGPDYPLEGIFEKRGGMILALFVPDGTGMRTRSILLANIISIEIFDEGRTKEWKVALLTWPHPLGIAEEEVRNASEDHSSGPQLAGYFDFFRRALRL